MLEPLHGTRTKLGSCRVCGTMMLAKNQTPIHPKKKSILDCSWTGMGEGEPATAGHHPSPPRPFFRHQRRTTSLQWIVERYGKGATTNNLVCYEALAWQAKQPKLRPLIIAEETPPSGQSKGGTRCNIIFCCCDVCLIRRQRSMEQLGLR